MSDKNNVTMLGPRGQLSIPSSIRATHKLKPGHKFRWKVNEDGSLLVVPLGTPKNAAGIFAVLGCALKYRQNREKTSDEILGELREGE
jgi:bifunctional DNA-binding transcriptional regulator/antitoxin component of YhaV-PrlF toxin-antitoxin module